jgi:hypothetical protein
MDKSISKVRITILSLSARAGHPGVGPVALPKSDGLKSLLGLSFPADAESASADAEAAETADTARAIARGIIR